MSSEFNSNAYVTSNISNPIRARLKRLYTDPDPGGWDWDEGQWDWELSLRDRQEDVDCGYVAIVPLKDGKPFEYQIPPEPWHDDWALRFVVDLTDTRDHIPSDLFRIRGTLPEVKRQLDMLLGADTPEIPNFPSPEPW